jgi:hypothetical protein
MDAVNDEPGDFVACDGTIAVLGKVLQARLEPLARDLVKMKYRQHPAERAAEEKCGVTPGRKIQQPAQRATALGERHSGSHEDSDGSILLGALY